MQNIKIVAGIGGDCNCAVQLGNNSPIGRAIASAHPLDPQGPRASHDATAADREIHRENLGMLDCRGCK